jgi:putative zinc finger/helix-turn-helix YgiT family protein
MKEVCPNCEQLVAVDHVSKVENFEIRGDIISVEADFYRCKQCGTEFVDPMSSRDYLQEAYQVYRNIHGFMTPRDILNVRKHLGLTQRELSSLLGFGAITLSRYENGALQSESHNQILEFLKDNKNVLALVERKGSLLPSDKRDSIVRRLKSEMNDREMLSSCINSSIFQYDPGIESGYRRLSLEKVVNSILYFCSSGIFKTKLLKLLFYADFKHFKLYSNSITGLRYVHLPHGPVPDKFEHILAAMTCDMKNIIVEEVVFDSFVGEKVVSTEQPVLELFSDSELRVLNDVSRYFLKFTAKQIRDYSHDEEAYLETNMLENISYKYADSLRM